MKFEENNTCNTCNFFTQRSAEINGRKAWLYLIDSPIGNIFVVEWENEGKEIQTKVFYNDRDGAEKRYKNILKKMVNA